MELTYSDTMLTLARSQGDATSNLVRVTRAYASRLLQRIVHCATRMYSDFFDDSFPTIGDDLLVAWQRRALYTDCAFIVEDKPVRAHRAILCARSEYFRGLLMGGLKESRQEYIELQHVREPTFMAVMEFMYTSELNFEYDATLEELLSLANEYMLDDMRLRCAEELKKLMREDGRTEVIEHALYLAKFYTLQPLEMSCVELLEALQSPSILPQSLDSELPNFELPMVFEAGRTGCVQSSNDS